MQQNNYNTHQPLIRTSQIVRENEWRPQNSMEKGSFSFETLSTVIMSLRQETVFQLKYNYGSFLIVSYWI